METPTQVPSFVPSTLSDDEVFAITRGVRVAVISDLMAGGKVSDENSDRILLTNMLNGLDSQANASKRMQLESKTISNTAAMIAAVLDGVNKNTIFANTDVTDVTFDETRVMLPASMPTPDAVPGELEVDAAQMDYASFLRSQGLDESSLGSNIVEEDDGDEF